MKRAKLDSPSRTQREAAIRQKRQARHCGALRDQDHEPGATGSATRPPPDLPAADMENGVPLISPPRRTGYETDRNGFPGVRRRPENEKPQHMMPGLADHPAYIRR